MMRRFLLVITLGLAIGLGGCTQAVSGRTWHPVLDAEEASPGRGLTLVLPGQGRSDIPGERGDPERFLVMGVHYDACTHAAPGLVGLADDRIEVQLTDLNRMCVRPMPRVAWFSIPWSELPDPVVVVDQHGAETRLHDRRQV